VPACSGLGGAGWFGVFRAVPVLSNLPLPLRKKMIKMTK
jgi:hypothetical protein